MLLRHPGHFHVDAYAGNASVTISFNYSGYNAHTWQVDDVSITGDPAGITCDDAAACNDGAAEACLYVVDCNSVCGGTATDAGCGCGNPGADYGYECDGTCPDTEVSINLVDSFGDGWNGGNLNFPR